MTNRREAIVHETIDRRNARRPARTARMATHAREALADVAGAVDQVDSREDRIMRLKARMTAHAVALGKEIGPASLVAFCGSIAGHFGGDLKPQRRAVSDPWADKGEI